MQENPRREYVRHTVDVPLEVREVAGRPATQQSVNVSFGGLAFVADTCPAAGSTIALRIPSVDPPFEAEARVAWCRPHGEGYLVGVQFLSASDAFRSRMVQQVCAIDQYRRQVLRDEGRELAPQEAAAEWIARFGGRFPDSASR
jgi:c-di-GMP-binding flagellar brake protein YcgR